MNFNDFQVFENDCCYDVICFSYIFTCLPYECLRNNISLHYFYDFLIVDAVTPLQQRSFLHAEGDATAGRKTKPNARKLLRHACSDAILRYELRIRRKPARRSRVPKP